MRGLLHLTSLISRELNAPAPGLGAMVGVDVEVPIGSPIRRRAALERGVDAGSESERLTSELAYQCERSDAETEQYER